jgi:hypothetical protein
MDYSATNYRTFFSIVDVLSKRLPIKKLWMVHNGGSTLKGYDSNVDTYNVFAFSDFVEIMEVLKPDLVISIGGDFEYLERSMLKAAKARGIPTVDIVSSVYELNYLEKGPSNTIFSGRLNAIGERGKYILSKYIFLIKTLYRASYGFKYIGTTILKDIYLPLSAFVPRYNFGGGDLNIVPTPDWLDILTKKGISGDTIVVTGECSMDPVFHDLNKRNQTVSKNFVNSTKFRILFITSPMVEHGYLKSTMRDDMVRKVFKGLREKFGHAIELKIKIHPVNEDVNTYKDLIKDIDSEVPIIQKANLLDLLEETDLTIGYGFTSAFLQAVLLRKPVILLNFYNDTYKNIYIREKLITECTSVDELIDMINEKSYRINDDVTISKTIQNIFYKFDGKCCERAADAIFNLLKTHSKIQSI